MARQNDLQSADVAPENSPRAPEAGALGRAPPIDLDRLRSQTFGDEALIDEILQLFDRQAEEMIAALQEFSLAQRHSYLHLAHKQVGSALGVAAGPLAQAARRLEALLRAERPEPSQIGEAVEALIANLVKTRAFALRLRTRA